MLWHVKPGPWGWVKQPPVSEHTAGSRASRDMSCDRTQYTGFCWGPLKLDYPEVVLPRQRVCRNKPGLGVPCLLQHYLSGSLRFTSWERGEKRKRGKALRTPLWCTTCPHTQLAGVSVKSFMFNICTYLEENVVRSLISQKVCMWRINMVLICVFQAWMMHNDTLLCSYIKQKLIAEETKCAIMCVCPWTHHLLFVI